MKVSKHNSMGIKVRKPDCIYYKRCLDKAAFANDENMTCKSCGEYKAKIPYYMDYPNRDADSFDEHNVGEM